MHEILARLEQVDLGYPKDTHKIPRSEDTTALRVPSLPKQTELQLNEFYSQYDHISLPDVGNGYFLLPKQEIGKQRGDSFITVLSGKIEGEVLPIGSTGGGDYFVILKSTGDILQISDGSISNGVYSDYWGSTKSIAPSFFLFLEWLREECEYWLKVIQ